MSLVDNARNPRGFQTKPKDEIQFITTSAVLPTLTIDTNIYDLGQVLIDGIIAVLTTDYTFSGGVLTPVGAATGAVFTVERVTKSEEVDTRPL